MRYSGLAIGDAVTLCREALVGTELTLRRAKTGELVMVDLPHLVVRALRRLRGPSPDYFWWSGRGKRVTSAKYWRGRLAEIAARAGVARFHPHRLRDTFAVALLTAGVSIEDVSSLLGHSSIQTTERHYAPWDRRRRDRLTRVVRAANRLDPLLAELDPLSGEGEGAETERGRSLEGARQQDRPVSDLVISAVNALTRIAGPAGSAVPRISAGFARGQADPPGRLAAPLAPGRGCAHTIQVQSSPVLRSPNNIDVSLIPDDTNPPLISVKELSRPWLAAHCRTRIDAVART